MIGSTGQKYTPIFYPSFPSMKSSGSMLKTHKSQSSNGPTGPDSDDNFPLFSPDFGSGAFQLDSWSTSQAVKPSQADFLLKKLGQFIGIKLSTHGVQPGFQTPLKKVVAKEDEFGAFPNLRYFKGNFSGVICCLNFGIRVSEKKKPVELPTLFWLT